MATIKTLMKLRDKVKNQISRKKEKHAGSSITVDKSSKKSRKTTNEGENDQYDELLRELQLMEEQIEE